MKKKILSIVLLGSLFATMLSGCSINETVDHTDEYTSPISEEKAEEIMAENYEAAEWTEEDEDPNDPSPTYGPDADFLSSFSSFDYWKFKNYGSEQYNVSSDDAGKLLSELSNTDKMTIRQMLLYKKPAGHCYGMSITAALVNKGTKSASELSNAAALKSASKSDSVLEYYFVQQALSLSVNKQTEFLELSNDKQISRLMRIALSGEPFVVAYGWYKDASSTETGHAVVGYGIESGNWSKQFDFRGRSYPYRIHIYDSNYPDDESGAYDIYVNADENTWCVPGYKIYSTSEKNQKGSEVNNGRLYRIVTDDDYLNVVDYSTGATSNAYKVSNGASVPCITVEGDTDLCIETSQGNVSITGTIINDSSLNGIQAFSMCDTAENSSAVFITMPESSSYYRIDSENKELDFIFRVGSTCLFVDSSASGEATIKENGEVEILSDDEKATTKIEYTTSDENARSEGSNSVTVIEHEGSHLTITPTINDIRVLGDASSKIELSAEKYGTSTKPVTVDSGGNNLSISADSRNFTIKDASTGSVIATEAVPTLDASLSLKPKKASYTGKTINIDAASKKNISGKIYYVYYTDKKCTKLAKNHKDVGTYYVQAKSMLNGYAVKSNIVKLEITKSSTAVKFSKTAFNCKASALKKKSQTFQLKTTAKGAVAFKKVTGNKNISLSSSGKISIKNGTKAGTYKIKVVATPKNYKKKVTQTITIKIK